MFQIRPAPHHRTRVQGVMVVHRLPMPPTIRPLDRMWIQEVMRAVLLLPPLLLLQYFLPILFLPPRPRSLLRLLMYPILYFPLIRLCRAHALFFSMSILSS